MLGSAHNLFGRCSISRRVSEDRMAAAVAMLTAIFSDAADRSGLKAD